MGKAVSLFVKCLKTYKPQKQSQAEETEVFLHLLTSGTLEIPGQKQQQQVH